MRPEDMPRPGLGFPRMETAAFDVERFERVDASAGTVLLRLSGTFSPDVEPGAPELLVDDGRDARHVKPLPDPSGGPAPGGDWRAAFPVPAELLTGSRIAYALSVPGAGGLAAPGPQRPG